MACLHLLDSVSHRHLGLVILALLGLTTLLGVVLVLLCRRLLPGKLTFGHGRFRRSQTPLTKRGPKHRLLFLGPLMGRNGYGRAKGCECSLYVYHHPPSCKRWCCGRGEGCLLSNLLCTRPISFSSAERIKSRGTDSQKG